MKKSCHGNATVAWSLLPPLLSVHSTGVRAHRISRFGYQCLWIGHRGYFRAALNDTPAISAYATGACRSTCGAISFQLGERPR